MWLVRVWLDYSNRDTKSGAGRSETQGADITLHRTVVTLTLHRTVVTPTLHRAVVTLILHRAVVTPTLHRTVVTLTLHRTVVTLTPVTQAHSLSPFSPNSHIVLISTKCRYAAPPVTQTVQ